MREAINYRAFQRKQKWVRALHPVKMAGICIVEAAILKRLTPAF